MDQTSSPRIGGADRVTGRAKYVAEFHPKGALYAALVESPVPSGRVVRVDRTAAEKSPGVRLVLTHENMPCLNPLPEQRGRERRHPLQDDRIVHAGQHLALVVADTLERAQHAATLLRFEIEKAPFDVSLAFDDPRAQAPEGFAEKRGDAAAAFARAERKHEADYTTPTEHHNPMETVATLAEWHGDELHVFETSRQIKSMQAALATSFELPREKVHLQCPLAGGAFGSKGFFYGHILMTAVAAQMLGRPVRLQTTRRQMFGSQGHRPRTIQRLQLAATSEGKLAATRHLSLNDTSVVSTFIEDNGLTTQKLYATETLETAHRCVALNLSAPIYMRAPGEATGPFALESAMDELAILLGVDPVELRLRNDQASDPRSGKPWSTRRLRECFEQASARFDWERRDPKPRSMREGHELVGYGCAGLAYRANQSPATVRATLGKDGVAVFRAAASEVGQGATTAMADVAAEALGFPRDRVRFECGDSAFSQAPGAGGSTTAASVGNAIMAAAEKLKAKLDDRLPVEVEASTDPKLDESPFAFSSWGAAFAEVRVDEDLGTVRCARFVGMYDVGRVLNARMVRSQLQGGVIWGIGMALHEHTAIDHGLGVYANRDLAEYHVPVNADVPELDVSWLGIPDPHFGALEAHGVGEVGIAGAAPAIANAVFHATGKRVRDLPITLDKLL